eukprot:1160207-Pelagomonas_calceolata.AAC.2
MGAADDWQSAWSLCTNESCQSMHNRGHVVYAQTRACSLCTMSLASGLAKCSLWPTCGLVWHRVQVRGEQGLKVLPPAAGCVCGSLCASSRSSHWRVLLLLLLLVLLGAVLMVRRAASEGGIIGAAQSQYALHA